MEIITKKVEELIPYKNNPRNNDKAIESVANSIREFGFKVPIVIDKNNIIVAGHTRLLASKSLGLKEVPCIIADDLTEDKIKAFRLADNKVAEIAEWDLERLNEELKELANFEIDMSQFGFLEDSIQEIDIIEDEVPTIDENKQPKAKIGQVYKLGNHRLMCGDSTSKDDINKLLDGARIDMVFTDPPYGMKKEKDGIANDNLNYDDLLEFNKKWIPLTFEMLKDNGSWYCWGIDEPLMDIYAFILKPMINENKITFRNLITWDKGHGQGQLSADFRMYPIADEKCLFVMCGVQGFNNNADNYFEGWEPLRDYLLESRKAMGWDVPTMKKIVGHSDLSRDHWTSKSQWNMPTRDVYEKMQAAAENQRKEQGINNDAFKREYDDLKREYYSTRAYFDNTHDNMNNVWHFDRTSNQERELTGGHATPKPIALCTRAIKSSSRENENVLDVFGGSGSTLIACEQNNRNCYVMELEPKWVDIIIERWEKFTGKKAELIDG